MENNLVINTENLTKTYQMGEVEVQALRGVAYFPLYLASRDLSAVEIAGVLALPAIARIIVPTAGGSIADRTGALAPSSPRRAPRPRPCLP